MHVNYVFLPVAAIAAFLFGAVWYGALFSKAWVASLGRSEEELKARARPMPLLFGGTIIAELVMAWVFAGMMTHMGAAGFAVNAHNGALAGAFCWLGFVATTVVVNHGYEGAKPIQTLIDAGHWLGVLLIEGAIIGMWGVR
jgi:Protein of unknown function (DUF1761)